MQTNAIGQFYESIKVNYFLVSSVLRATILRRRRFLKYQHMSLGHVKIVADVRMCELGSKASSFLYTPERAKD